MSEIIPDGYLDIGTTAVNNTISYTRYYFKHLRGWHKDATGIVLSFTEEAIADNANSHQHDRIYIPWSTIFQLKVKCNSPEIIAALFAEEVSERVNPNDN